MVAIYGPFFLKGNVNRPLAELHFYSIVFLGFLV